MSGIFGIVRPPDAPVAEAELAPMADALKHRGPDGVMVFGRDNIGLGHCMLHSTPESLHEKLPLRVGASGLTITADARIDNRKQLIADIPVNQANGQIITDSELILHAYSKWGKACVEKLLGDFVFAIWDENRQCLFVARDHMGCKPFYYHHNRVQLVFASSAVGVNAAHCVSTNINRGRVADCLVEFLEGIDKTSTFFTGIYRLPPGHTLSYQGGELTTHCYWQPTLGIPIRYSRDEDYLEAFEEIFQQAVSDRLRTHCRPAAMLSGGIDSSVIAAIARTQLETAGAGNLQTYTVFNDSISDCKEAYHARLLVSQGGVDSHEIGLDDIPKFSSELEDWRLGLEDPFDFEMIVNVLVHLQASNNGSRMILTGIDGDMVAGLTSSYIAHILREGQWLEAWQEARGLVKNHASYASTAVGEFWKSSLQAVVPTFIREIRRPFLVSAQTRNAINTTLISKKFAEEVGLRNRIISSLGGPGREDLAHTHQQTLRASYLTAGIERYERVAAAGGVEPRHPLLDKRVIDFMLNIPRQQKFRHGWTKFLLRRLAALHTPDEIAWRTSSDHPGWRFNARWKSMLREGAVGALDYSENAGFSGVIQRPDTSSKLSAEELRYLEVEAANMLMWLGRFV